TLRGAARPVRPRGGAAACPQAPRRLCRSRRRGRVRPGRGGPGRAGHGDGDGARRRPPRPHLRRAHEARGVSTVTGDLVVNALPLPVLTVGPDGDILDANPAAETFFDVSVRVMRRQTLADVVPFG